MEALAGYHCVREALRARRRRLLRVWIRSPAPRGAQEIQDLADAAGVPVEWAPEAELEAKLPPGARSQGLVLEAESIPEQGLEAALALPVGERPLVVALDGVEDPQNVGALLRAADAAGASGAILPERHAPPLGAAVSRASAGALEHLPIARVVNLARALGQAKERGFWVVALDPEGGEDLFAAPDRVFEGDLALVVGGEEQGVRHGIRRLADHRVSIPMRGRVHSLNVAAAAAVALFEWARRRTPRGAGGPGS
jgi:23S rRNA (guanosine2251-2'-O)-methyltransferase